MEPTELQSSAPRNWRRGLLLTSVGLLVVATASLPVVGGSAPTTHVANRSGTHRALTPLDVPDGTVAADVEGDGVDTTHTTVSVITTTVTSLTTSTTRDPVSDPEQCCDLPGPPVVTDPHIVQYKLPRKTSYPQRIVAGPDGALWFAEQNTNTIGRITTDGEITEYPLPSSFATPLDIVVGPDNALWFTDANAPYVGRITVSGKVTAYATGIAAYYSMVVAPDGSLWYTSYNGDAPGGLVRLTTGGDVTTFDVGRSPRDLVVSPDGNIWATDFTDLLRITPDGVATAFPASPDDGHPTAGITVGPDGALWFTAPPFDADHAEIGRVAADGSIAYLPLPGGADEVIAGPDGNLWYAGDDAIGRVTPAGVVTTWAVRRPVGLAVGPDGNIWFANDLGAAIGVIEL